LSEARAHRPDEIGPYLLLEPLGQGGMGVVYRAQHKESKQRVALKTVRVRHESLLAGIRREIRALMRVNHPGVVRILGEGVADGVPWYAMELLEGATLRDHFRTIWAGIAGGETHEAPTRLRNQARGEKSTLEVAPDEIQLASMPILPRSEPLPAAGGQLPQALAPLKQLCEALAFLHGEGIVHRDLKPENVFLRPDGRPVLMDFGIVSQFIGTAGREVLEVGGFSTGTAGYMAPEQIHGERVDARADLYALGCMLYEVIVGLQAFPGYTAAMLQQHLISDPQPPSELVYGLPAELEELVMHLLAKRPRDRIGHASDVVQVLARYVDTPEMGGPPARDYLYRPDLVGRGEATDIVVAHLEAALGGRGALILVGGESGVGKTTLAVEASRLATVRGMQVKTGECLAISVDGQKHAVRAAPLHPLREVLQSLCDRCLVEGASLGDRLLGPRGKILAAVEPRLAQLPGAADYPDPPELPADAARRRLFTALTDTLLNLAAEKPLLLILDDLQWADELTLAWLRALAPDLPINGLVVFGTYRVEERSQPLDDLLATPGAVLVELKRLPPPAVRAMVAEMLSLSEPPAEFVQFLVVHSEGNPFFIAEYLRAAVAGSYLLRDESGGWRVDARVPFSSLVLPHSLRELVARRLEGLSPAARRLCQAAAVLGRAFDGDLPRLVAGLSDDEVMEALDQVINRTIFELEEGERLRFQHDKLREIAYAMIDEADRPSLHLKAALAIEERHQDDLPRFYTALAHHFEVGGLPARALDFLEKAGEAALRSAAYGDAADAFTRALELDRRHGPSAAAPRRARWEHAMGKALFGLGDLAAAESYTRSALEDLGHGLPSTSLQWGLRLAGEAARQLAHRLPLLGRLDRLRVAPRSDEPLRDLDEAAQAAALITHRYYYAGDPIAMITASLLSVNLAERADLGWQVPHSYSWLGYLAGLLRRPRLAREYFERARAGAARRNEPSEAAFALTIEATYHLGFGRFLDAEERLQQALALCGSDAQMLELTLSALGHVEHHTGRDALARYQALGTSAAARKNRQRTTWAEIYQARSLMAFGDFEGAAPLLDDARRSLGERPELYSEIICLGLLSLTRFQLDERESARRLALETLARLAHSRPIGFAILDGCDAAAEVLRLLGEPRLLRQIVASLDRLARLFPLAAPAASYHAGHLHRRPRSFQRALQLARQLGMPREVVRAEAALNRR
jgi:serine/threonine protein kinase